MPIQLRTSPPAAVDKEGSVWVYDTSASATNSVAAPSTAAPASWPAGVSERRNAARQSAGCARRPLREIAREAIVVPSSSGRRASSSSTDSQSRIAFCSYFLTRLCVRFASGQAVDRGPAVPAEAVGAAAVEAAEGDDRNGRVPGQQAEPDRPQRAAAWVRARRERRGQQHGVGTGQGGASNLAQRVSGGERD